MSWSGGLPEEGLWIKPEGRELAVGPWRRDTGYTAEETAGVEASLRQQGVPERQGARPCWALEHRVVPQ